MSFPIPDVLDAVVLEAHNKARKLVAAHIDDFYQFNGLTTIETHLVWFARTLQHWKAVVVSPMLPQKYFEVTYNGDKKETYIDVYYKDRNVVVSDQ